MGLSMMDWGLTPINVGRKQPFCQLFFELNFYGAI